MLFADHAFSFFSKLDCRVIKEVQIISAFQFSQAVDEIVLCYVA